MKSKLKSMHKKEENLLSRKVYRPLSEKIAILFSKTSITPNQVTFISIIMALISGVFFALGTWEYLLVAFVFLQLTYLFDCVDGNLARYTDRGTPLGEWYDLMSNKLHKFFFLLGASIGVFRMTENYIYLILGSIAIFNWHFTAYISETSKRLFQKKEDRPQVFKGKNTYLPINLLALNLLGLFALINKVAYALWFFSILGSLWTIVKVYSIHKKWKKKNK